jgi:hypothetical protein
VVVDAEGQEAVAELLRRDEVGGYGGEGEERFVEGRGGGGWVDYAAGWDLVKDAGTCLLLR